MNTAQLEQSIFAKLNQKDTDAIVLFFGPHWFKTPPLSLVYLENFLRAHNYSITVVDLNALFFQLLNIPHKEWLTLNAGLEKNLLHVINKNFPGLVDKMLACLARSPACLIGFSLFSRNRIHTIHCAQRLSALCPDKTFVFGGPEVLFEYHRENFFPEITHQKSYFVVGEGELPLLSIIKHSSSSIQPTKHQGKDIFLHQEIDSLDSLPDLNFDCLGHECYSTKTLPLLSSRGCIRRCSFCSEHKLFQKFRQHSPQYMINQIRFLVQRYQRNMFSFHDSLLNADTRWLKEFCSLLIKEDLSVLWEAQMIIRNDMSDALLKLIKQSGCYTIFIGLESASDNILRRMHKGFTQEDAKNFFRQLHSHGLQFEISLITGFPEEAERDFLETLKFLQENKAIIPKIAQVNPFVEYAPSELNTQTKELKELSLNRVQQLLGMFGNEKIKFTSAFINNLVGE